MRTSEPMENGLPLYMCTALYGAIHKMTNEWYKKLTSNYDTSTSQGTSFVLNESDGIFFCCFLFGTLFYYIVCNLTLTGKCSNLCQLYSFVGRYTFPAFIFPISLARLRKSFYSLIRVEVFMFILTCNHN